MVRISEQVGGVGMQTVKLPAQLRRGLAALADLFAAGASNTEVSEQLQSLQRQFFLAWNKGQITSAQERCFAARLHELLAAVDLPFAGFSD